MNKSLYIVLTLLLFISGCNKQEKKSFSTNPQIKDKNLFLLFDKANMDSLPYNVKHAYNDKALHIISSRSNDSLNRAYHFKVAARYYNMNAMEDYKKVTRKIINASISKNDSASLAKAYSFMGDYYSKVVRSDSAYQYYLNAEKIYKRLKDNQSNVAKELLNKAILQHNEGDFVGCEKSAIEALNYLKNSSDDLMVYETNNILGIIYNELKEYDKSLEFHNAALTIAEHNNIYPEYHARSTSLNNIGYVYKNMGRHKLSMEQFKEALKDDKIFIDKTPLYAALLDNLAYAELQSGNYNQVSNLFFKSLQIRDSLQIIPGIISSNLNLSEYYVIKKDNVNALKYAYKAYNVAKKNKLYTDLLFTIKQLNIVEPQKSPEHSAEYIKITDSLQLAERQIRNKLGRIEYETDQLATEKANLVEQRKTLIYIALGIILIGVFIFVIRFQAAKNRELRLVQEQQAANEEIYRLMITQQEQVEETRQAEKKRIAQEIHDGVLGKLFGTRMHLGLLNDKDGREAHVERVTYIDELKTLEQELREISHDLNSEKQAVANNFVQMVMNFIDTQRTVCKAEIVIGIDKKIDWTAVDSLAKINLYRILQEAFQNVNKHAQAQKVTVNFTQQEDNIILTVSDDGVGFNYTKKKKGIGMLNMHSRITGSGGTMVVNTTPGQGTRLEFLLPLNNGL